MIIVTGGAGFIGSNIVKALNREGIDKIMVVDNLSNAEKIKNLADLKIIDFMDKHEFYEFMSAGKKFESVSAVFHQGACSDTMETDGKYVLHNNFTYSKELFHFSQTHHAQFIYASSASVYGSGTVFAEEPENESTLNAYAWSKLLFDNYIRNCHFLKIQCAGLRYFNVYGPGESHKGRMASVAWHFYNQFVEDGKVRLFTGTDGYADGEQMRDFVFVDDVVAVNLFLLKNPGISGVFNVGTGKCQSFNDVALAVINNCRQRMNKESVAIDKAVANGEIEYIPMPAGLEGKYQSYTQADLNKLRSAGYDGSFSTVTHGVKEYISCLESR
jgi:ADP-L-glycero-D-manno-heptose 6-epimerase